MYSTTLWMSSVIFVASRSWCFKSFELFSSTKLSIFSSSILSESCHFIFDKINWSRTVNLKSHSRVLFPVVPYLTVFGIGNWRANEKVGFIDLVKSCFPLPHVVGNAYRPGPGPRSLASIRIDFESWLITPHLLIFNWLSLAELFCFDQILETFKILFKHLLKKPYGCNHWLPIRSS